MLIDPPASQQAATTRRLNAPTQDEPLNINLLLELDSTMTQILDGIDDILDRWLGTHGREEFGTTSKVPQFKSKTAAIRLSENRGPLADSESPADLIKSCMGRLDANLAAIGTDNVSTNNWKWMKSLTLASHNTSPETTLEKLVAFLLSDDWVNQIPVCNGLVDGGASNCRIDLGYRVEELAYELIELKYHDDDDSSGGSDNPLYAALEMLRYGLLYLLFRKHDLLKGRRSNDHHILSATSITLVVLAPERWFNYRTRDGRDERFELEWLQSALTTGLQEYVGDEESIALDTMSFRFESLSDEFERNYRPLVQAIGDFRIENLESRAGVFG